MTRNLLIGASALFLGLCIGVSVVRSDEKTGQPQPPMTPEQQAEMEAWQKAATPGPQHEKFKESVGTWKTECKHWMAPGGEPVVSSGSSTFELILGGRYLTEVFKGEAWGQPFEGHAICGYDNIKKKYVSTWIDNMGTGIMYMEGDYDPTTKTHTSSGEMICPITNTPQKMRCVVKELSPTQRVMEMYGPNKEGTEYKCMEIAYTKG